MVALKRALLVLIGSALFTGVAAAVTTRGVTVSDPGLSPITRAVGSFLGTVVVGALVLAVKPRYADRITDRARAEPGEAVLWGIGVLALFIGAVVLLAATVVGIVVVIPLTVAFVVLGALGNALGYVTLFDSVTGSPWTALLAGGLVAGATGAIPLLGDVVGFFVGSLGVGAIVRDWRA